MDEEILHLERQILVWNKPAGVESHDPLALERLKTKIKTIEGREGNPFLHPAHQLDQPTSGILILARTSKALSRLSESFRERKVTKKYLAWVEGEIEESGEWEDNLVHGSGRAHLGEGGKVSTLSFKRLKKERGKSLLLIDLETGRYHQIRIQLASRGFPILGDVKYGARRIEKVPGIFLHHFLFSIPHPITGEILNFSAPPPPYFELGEEWKAWTTA